MKNLKPNKLSFFIFKTSIIFFIILGLISFLLIIFFNNYIISLSEELKHNSQFIFLFPIIFFIFALLSFIWNTYVYKKELYNFENTKIVYDYGSIFSDSNVEIQFNKITEVSVVLGFWQYLFFKTGDINIKTAGSSTSKIVFKNIDNPMDMYENMQIYMKNNGYHLTKDKLVQEEKPHWLGIFREILGSIGAFTIIILYFGFASIMGFMEKIKNGGIKELYENIILGKIDTMAIILGIVFVIVMTFIILKYMDLKRRKYQIFTDSIFYTEGFLTKHYSFLPMERVSDCENTQGLFSRIFGLHDIVVSSEGSNNKVVFKNMKNGEIMMKNIKYLKNEITINDVESENKEISQNNEANIVGYKNKIEKSFKYNKDFEGIYKMNPLRTFIGSILLTILAIIMLLVSGKEGIHISVGLLYPAVILFIGSIFQLLFTIYTIENSSIESRYKFLSNKHNSFSVDKITKITIKEDIIDMILGTCSIKFYSIGSSSNIVFRNITKTKKIKEMVLQKVGIYDKEKNPLNIKFSLSNYFKANILNFIITIVVITSGGLILFKNISESINTNIKYTSITTLVTILVIICIILFTILYIYKKIYYTRRFYIQNYNENYIESIKGIFIKSYSYIRLENIKGFTSTKYPGTKDGIFELNIAGDIITTNGKNGQTTYIGIKLPIHYVENIREIHDIFDNTITDNKLDTKVIMHSKQNIGNTLLILIIIFTIINMGIFAVIYTEKEYIWIAYMILILSIIRIIISIIYVNMKLYIVEEGRIIKLYGIIYKSKQSIVFEKFNFVEKNQGPIGKIFKNGTLSIYTLGSGNVDMSLEDVDEFNEMYNTLKE